MPVLIVRRVRKGATRDFQSADIAQGKKFLFTRDIPIIVQLPSRAFIGSIVLARLDSYFSASKAALSVPLLCHELI